MLRKEIEEIIRRDVSDPRICFFTITYIHTTGDLKNVKVGISFIGDEKQVENAFRGILSAQKFIQYKLGQKISLKFTPILEFELDERKEYRIEKLLKEIKEENEK
ncbi:MAG: 30S ribosome-binding factor RbfA [Candidatus Omnitrophica bacterium]|nr:30S ribosome-binding factor RbfA [Candidatus Omnitrophota bacterium]MCM8809477.1 30S ribosome-binding factor RbfA [Candidatus Omnitrophota bacterium]MCM8810833.1 30S ribosome-binding factor RbfA [Candidatus Omnitrophota bacterium]